MHSKNLRVKQFVVHASFEVIAAVATKTAVFWMRCLPAWQKLVDISEKSTVSFFRVESIPQCWRRRHHARSEVCKFLPNYTPSCSI